MKNNIWGVVLAVVGAVALGGIALYRQEPINALWIVTAAVCIYLLGYRFYAAWIAARVLSVDRSRATPAERHDNGRDFVPTHRWIVFGHHFAAIAGPGPLVGPTLAAQFGYLPGTLWIMVGAVLGGCVQDMTILLLSTRRDGRSLGQMARDELGPLGGFAAVIGGGWIDNNVTLRAAFDFQPVPLAGFVIVYGWLAAILPVWLLLAPRDYLSTFLKLGTVGALAIALLLMHPQIKMPALTQF